MTALWLRRAPENRRLASKGSIRRGGGICRIWLAGLGSGTVRGSGGTIADVVTLALFRQGAGRRTLFIVGMLRIYRAQCVESVYQRRCCPTIAGELQLALAFAEPQSGTPERGRTMAVQDGDGYRLSGHKTLVLGAVGR